MINTQAQDAAIKAVISWDELKSLAAEFGQQAMTVQNARDTKRDFIRILGLKSSDGKTVEENLQAKLSDADFCVKFAKQLQEKIADGISQSRSAHAGRPTYTSRPTRTECALFGELCDLRSIYGRWVTLAIRDNKVA